MQSVTAVARQQFGQAHVLQPAVGPPASEQQVAHLPQPHVPPSQPGDSNPIICFWTPVASCSGSHPGGVSSSSLFHITLAFKICCRRSLNSADAMSMHRPSALHRARASTLPRQAGSSDIMRDTSMILACIASIAGDGPLSMAKGLGVTFSYAGGGGAEGAPYSPYMVELLRLARRIYAATTPSCGLPAGDVASTLI